MSYSEEAEALVKAYKEGRDNALSRLDRLIEYTEEIKIQRDNALAKLEKVHSILSEPVLSPTVQTVMAEKRLGHKWSSEGTAELHWCSNCEIGISDPRAKAFCPGPTR